MPNIISPDKNATMTILLGIHIKYYYIYRIYIIVAFWNYHYTGVNTKPESY